MENNQVELLHGLYGSELRSSKAVGYCKYHQAALTTKTLKKHECLGKQCRALIKYENHDYWRQREVVKARRKAKKNGGVN